jgi:hypothetical protein
MNLRIPRRHGHYVFGLIQSGLTCLIAAAIASYPEPSIRRYIAHWMIAWAISWLTMLPVVLLAAPHIRALVNRVTSD